MKRKFVVSIKKHLNDLKEHELKKPPATRRPVPTLSHLAEVTGMTRQAMSKLANGKTHIVNLDVLADVIAELRRWGFTETDLCHILVPKEK